MAGDWIKMRTDLRDDPAVVRMSDLLGIDEDFIVGKLHRLWSWADRHTISGKTNGVGEKWIDRYVVQQGFARAMQDPGVAWLVVDGDSIEFPHFERHNGDSAKRRADNALRQRLSREMRDNGVTGVARDLIPRPFERKVFERDRYKCVYCGTKSNAETEASRFSRLSIDHIQPNTRGGKTVMQNLVCCCKLCNAEKSDRTPEEWGRKLKYMQKGFKYSNGLVTEMSQEECDESATRGEESRVEKKNTRSTRGPTILIPPERFSEWFHLAASLGRDVPTTKKRDAAIPGMVAVLAIAGIVPEAAAIDAAQGVARVSPAPENPVAYFWTCLVNSCPGVDLSDAMRRVKMPRGKHRPHKADLENILAMTLSAKGKP